MSLTWFEAAVLMSSRFSEESWNLMGVGGGRSERTSVVSKSSLLLKMHMLT
jgi:hypothetical protein